MKAKDAKLAAQLVEALESLSNVRDALTDRPVHKYGQRLYDGIYLEMQAAQMRFGESQGSDHWFDLPPAIGREILDAAEKIIRARLKKLGVTP